MPKTPFSNYSIKIKIKMKSKYNHIQYSEHFSVFLDLLQVAVLILFQNHNRLRRERHPYISNYLLKSRNFGYEICEYFLEYQCNFLHAFRICFFCEGCRAITTFKSLTMPNTNLHSLKLYIPDVCVLKSSSKSHTCGA